MLGRSKDCIKSEAEMELAKETCEALDLDGLVVSCPSSFDLCGDTKMTFRFCSCTRCWVADPAASFCQQINRAAFIVFLTSNPRRSAAFLEPTWSAS